MYNTMIFFKDITIFTHPALIQQEAEAVEDTAFPVRDTYITYINAGLYKQLHLTNIYNIS